MTVQFSAISFDNPFFLLLLALPVLFLFIGIRRLFAPHLVADRSSRRAELVVGSTVPWMEAWSKTEMQSGPLRHFAAKLAQSLPLLLRCMALALAIVALARPQAGPRGKSRQVDGLDIQLVIDTSGSMKAQDFVLDGKRRTRLEVVKSVIEKFISARQDDRIGLVIFGTEAFTQAPLTLDHQLLEQFLKHIEISMAGDSTAIGDGLATAVKRLSASDEKAAKSKGKIVILLTDGANNAGRIDPVTAAEAAKALNVKVYTIGVGSRGKVPIESNGRMVQVEVDIDEALLEKIASMTGGRFYRATDTQALISVYAEIDRLEKTKGRAPVREVRRELYAGFLWPAIVMLLLDVLFTLTRFKLVPR
jgi:Ca-activated chloride channel family protein